MRIIDVLLGIPYIILAFALIAVGRRAQRRHRDPRPRRDPWLGDRPHRPRQLPPAKELEYVEAARALGYPRRRIMCRHILPNVIQPVIVLAPSPSVR